MPVPTPTFRFGGRSNSEHAEKQASHRRALTGDLIKATMGTILAYITFAGAMGGAVYLLANDRFTVWLPS